MKYFLSLIIVFVITTSLKAQDKANSVSVMVGYGSFSMKDMRELQKSFVKSSEIPLQITNDFPGYVTFGVQYRRHLRGDLSVGGTVDFKSTGGRAHYGDYSGEASIVQQLKEYSVGGFIQQEFFRTNEYQFLFYLRASIGFTNLKLISELTVSGQKEKDSYSFNSMGFSGEPGIEVERRFGKIVIFVTLGYEINVNGKLYYSENDESYLQDENSNALEAQWSGVRSALGVGYQF